MDRPTLASKQLETSIVPRSQSMNNLVQLGKQIYRENPIMKDVAMVMEHPEFKAIYTKYFSDFNSLKTFVALLKTYEIVSSRISSQDVNAYHRIALVKKVIEEQPEVRRQIATSMARWVSTDYHTVENTSS
jgi:hypothetical protein